MKEIKNIEDLKDIAMSVQKMKSKPLPKGLSWFTKLMAKFGWHREYEVLIFDKSQLGFNSFINKEIKMKDSV